jgi:hypothetical protein
MYSDLFDECVCEGFSFLDPFSELFYNLLLKIFSFLCALSEFFMIRPDPDPPLK